MTYKLQPSDIIEIVNDYIGVKDGYLGDFSYRSHREFYPYYCGINNIDPEKIQGTTREKFLHILSSASSENQHKILIGLLKKYPFEKMSPDQQIEKIVIFNKIQEHLKYFGHGVKNALYTLKLSELSQLETIFSMYEAKEVLGEGGCGKVFLAEDSNKSKFAIKILNPEKATSEKIKRFKNEIFFSLKANHQNIIKILDLGYIRIGKEKYPFYVMPHYQKNFRRVMDIESDVIKKMTYFCSLIEGLKYAHTLNCWHRDLKPENILLDQTSDQLILTDFGIAHINDDMIITDIETKEGARLANFKYASPEQRMVGGAVDHRSDIYSLGLILNEIFTGEVPCGTDFRKVSDVKQNFSYLDKIIEKMLKQNVNDRMSNLDELKKALGLS